MKQLKFKCTLKTDVILNVKSASEGNNNTLDFIPGNNFLGMVAARLYNDGLSAEEALDLFHNGTVRYGDAHLAVDNIRTVKIPALIYRPKLATDGNTYYIYSQYDYARDEKQQQLKQCRSGFYAFLQDEKTGKKALCDKNYSQKSAYNRFTRTSEDSKMFGYEALDAGLDFFFSVETDKDQYAETLRNALVGTKHLGRSRTAQYGLVEIEECNFNECTSNVSVGGETTVYADGRLIFFDDYGQATYRPTAQQLGIEGGTVVWEKSQIRTFHYSPWNGKRRAYDADRCGIEKGSVFVVKDGTCNPLHNLVGSYLNEGFGKVIYNPDFLQTKSGTNGEALYTLQDQTPLVTTNTSQQASNDLLIVFLERRAHEEKAKNEVLGKVNSFVTKNKNLFRAEAFASQWGTIRSIALQYLDKEKIKTEINAYLTHGVAEEKWQKNGRKNKLDGFINEIDKTDNRWFRFAIVNLASQMAKAVKQEGAQ